MPLPYPRLMPEFDSAEAAYALEFVGPKLDTGCQAWLGAPFFDAELSKGVYGSIQLRGAQWKAHRVIYSIVRGPIPEGLVLDHLCGFASCVNSDHLEPVTAGENARRERPRNQARKLARVRELRATLMADQ